MPVRVDPCIPGAAHGPLRRHADLPPWIWATRAGRRWVVNVAAVFGAIHFYTQWFDKLGPTPISFLLGGLLMLAFALGLWTFNRRSEAGPA